MRQRGYTPVGVPNELVELVDMVCKEKNGFVSRQDFVRSSIMNQLEKLGYYAAEPRMEIEHIDESKHMIMMKDNKLHKHISVSFKNKKLFCNSCSSLDCDHLKVAKNLAIVQDWAKNNTNRYDSGHHKP
jgi:hypothetical protein